MAFNYEQRMNELYASGWQPGDPLPPDFFEAGPDGVYAAGEAPPPTGQPQPLPGGTAQPPQPGQPGVWEGMTDEEAQRYAGMGDLRRQMAQAEALRDTEALKGRYVNQGRTFVADHPLAHIVRGARIYKGQKDVKRIGKEQTEGRRAIIDLLRRRTGPNIDTITDVDLASIINNPTRVA